MAFQQKLLRWFRQSARPLPWREKYRPYEVWVSEIMLQQTQVETALPYFKRWMETFPTIGSLAAAESKKVLKMWEGLGYYSRARNLHESAKLISATYGGEFPSDFDSILSLKGIGRYSAGAIASIAFNQEKPIVDGNILRVLSRVYAIKKPIDLEKNKPIFWELQEKLIPKGRARDFNQALMELGALVCKKENPLCGSCPIQSFCKAYGQGSPEAYPIKQNKKKMVKVEAAALVLSKKGKYLIRKRPLGKIMGGLWEFPEWKLARDKQLAGRQVWAKTLEKAHAEICPDIKTINSLGAIKRNYTHHLETLHVFRTALANDAKTETPIEGWAQAWVTQKGFAKYPFSAAHAKITRLI